MSPLFTGISKGFGFSKIPPISGGGSVGYSEWTADVVTEIFGGTIPFGSSGWSYTIETSSRLRIEYSTSVSRNSSSGTSTGAGSVQYGPFDLSVLGSSLITFGAVGAGGGGSVGPCSNGGGGGGGAFSAALAVGDSNLTNVTIDWGERGRAGYQQTSRSSSSGPPYGVQHYGYDGGYTRITLTNGSFWQAGGGKGGYWDSCAGTLPGGSNNSAGGTSLSSGSTNEVSFTAYTGGSSIQGNHYGKGGGGGASPTGGNGSSFTDNGNGDGTYGTGGSSTSWSSPGSAGTGGQSGSGGSDAIGGLGSGGGTVETDSPNDNWTGYTGHGGGSAIWIVIG